MKNKIKKEFEHKLTCIISYFIINVCGFSFLLILYPRYLLFNDNSEEDKIK